MPYSPHRRRFPKYSPGGAGGVAYSQALPEAGDPPASPDFLWQLNEASGTRVAALGGQNLLESGGVVTSTPGILGNAARFTVAAGSHLRDATFGTPGIRTISMWYRPQGAASYAAAGDKILSGAYNAAVPTVDAAMRENQARTQIKLYNNAEPSTFTLNQVIGTWYYLFGVLQDTGGGNVGPNLSINGSAFQPPDFGGVLPLSAGVSTWEAGNAAGSVPSLQCEGDVDQLALWTTALTLSNGLYIYNGGAGRALP